MAKTNKDKQCNTKHIEERQTIPWLKLTRTNNVIQETSKNVRQCHILRCVLYNIVCPCAFWPWYCLTFFDVFCITLFVLLVLAMVLFDVLGCASSKNVRQYHGQNQQGQTMLYKTHRRTSDNTMAKTNKDKQCYTKPIEERQTIAWPKSTWTNNVIQSTSQEVRQYLVLVGFGHGIVWRSSKCFI
jgi:hypothetical protein